MNERSDQNALFLGAEDLLMTVGRKFPSVINKITQ